MSRKTNHEGIHPVRRKTPEASASPESIRDWSSNGVNLNIISSRRESRKEYLLHNLVGFAYFY
ncbi:MAG: hypothetical protein QME51_10845 [Planctomycetota bacterium]|nr:hypothetical protein [Planctomycetota bacterium]